MLFIILLLNFSLLRAFNMQIIGYILIGLGALDFILGNFANINLTGFLGAASSFTPIALIVVGGLLTQTGKK